MKHEARLTKIERHVGARVPAIAPYSDYSEAEKMKVLTRLAELSQEHGGPDGLRAYLEMHLTGYSPWGVDRDRLREKLIDMAGVMCSPAEDQAMSAERFCVKWAADKGA